MKFILWSRFFRKYFEQMGLLRRSLRPPRNDIRCVILKIVIASVAKQSQIEEIICS